MRLFGETLIYPLVYLLICFQADFAVVKKGFQLWFFLGETCAVDDLTIRPLNHCISAFESGLQTSVIESPPECIECLLLLRLGPPNRAFQAPRKIGEVLSRHTDPGLRVLLDDTLAELVDRLLLGIDTARELAT